MAEPAYTRLTRGHVRTGFTVAVTSRCSLWLGHDHLLFIDSNGYTEIYKRFYFRDIQALTLVLTRRRLHWNWIWASVGVLGLLAWSAVVLANPPMSMAGLITGGSLALLFAVLLLANNLPGPTCICQIKTAVQAEELPPLGRLPRARRVVAQLRPLISAAQSQLVRPIPPNQTDAVAAGDATDTATAPAPSPPANS